MLKKSLAVLSLLVFLPVAACNTVEGLGEDTQVAGQAVENAAQDAKN